MSACVWASERGYCDVELLGLGEYDQGGRLDNSSAGCPEVRKIAVADLVQRAEQVERRAVGAWKRCGGVAFRGYRGFGLH
ncbi:hypothetical protein [Saccharopolyspora pogona]|uniref:hypothetical protein n=1 Tax=Saccharopolyspora pogona TaxID=333966 RepID=UPI00168283B2|nr:hypothetical protein [Saccharopolyspora pogona]